MFVCARTSRVYSTELLRQFLVPDRIIWLFRYTMRHFYTTCGKPLMLLPNGTEWCLLLNFFPAFVKWVNVKLVSFGGTIPFVTNFSMQQFYRLRGSIPSARASMGVDLDALFLRFKIDFTVCLTQDSPVGPVATTCVSEGSGFDPGLGNKIPHATELRPGAANWKRRITWLILKGYQEDQMQRIGEWH